MNFLTNEKLVIVGAGGMIGSNMAQTAMMMKLTPNICLYDVYEPGLKGVVEEMYHCGFEGVNLTWTTDPETAFTDAKYIISSGGAPRKEGMTREDLLKGNCQIAEDFGKNVKKYCPDVKHVVVIFNPADLTGLVVLLHSGLKPSQVTTLAALDSTRLQSAIAKECGVPQSSVKGAHTFGGHGEQMAVFASKVTVDGKPFTEILGNEISAERWAEMKVEVIQGGSNIIKLRGRSSFQSPAYNSVCMIAASMGGEKFEWPAGCYVNNEKFQNVMMAMPTVIDATGVHYGEICGTEEEMAALEKSYRHLQNMRDEIISLGIIPAVADWKTVNPNL
ncbi:MAG: malate dehydrogenase [Bacteroidales bacterium]|nr:malate dehydrogenase [Bacteroidales bacterium]